MSGPSLLWFRRDLRLAANTAAAEASADGDAHAVFVLDPRLWASAGAPRQRALATALAGLGDELDGRLLIVEADATAAIPELARTLGVSRVVATREWTPYSDRRDSEVARQLEYDGKTLQLVGSSLVHEPGSIATKTGSQYCVFTPYHRQWGSLPVKRPGDGDASRFVVPPTSRGLPPLPEPAGPVDPIPPSARVDALAQLAAFADRAGSYGDARDRPGVDGTSHLSTALHFGTVHPAEIIDRLDARDEGHRAFIRQLAWRDFYAQILHYRPDSAWHDFRPEASVPVDTGPEAEAKFSAWQEGRTGFPFVDAGMRQLSAEGWMHNRARMVTASFLVKDLHLDWRWGARHFLRHLADGDMANNNHGWQWVAGTGTDASPYHRVFNPTTQGTRFDPDGAYIRRWVSELADADDSTVHEPGGSLVAAANGYPDPMVDHREERVEALARLELVKRSRQS